MSRPDWIAAGGFLSVFAMLVGLAAAVVIPGMGWAPFVGTVPGIAYLFATHFHHWSRTP